MIWHPQGLAGAVTGSGSRRRSGDRSAHSATNAKSAKVASFPTDWKRRTRSATVANALTLSPCETANEFDSKNPGVSALVERSQLAPGEQARYTTTFAPFELDE